MKKRFLIFGILVILLALVCVLIICKPVWLDRLAFWKPAASTEGTVPVSGVPLVFPETEEQTAALETQEESGDVEAAKQPEAEVQPETLTVEPYVSPIDFAALQKKNPDIYAWLFIEGSDISYPVVQNADDTFYLNHDENGEANSEGTIFSESAYNGTSFEDDITVLYGHHMKSGRMFGNLQVMYSDAELAENYKDIVVYTPEKELHYRVFAAVPYDNVHIPYNYGKAGDRGFLVFLHSLSSVRSMDAVIDEENFPGLGDRILVLSTCLRGDNTKRYLVVAKLVES